MCNNTEQEEAQQGIALGYGREKGASNILVTDPFSF
jgi:hypothetical protein